MDFYPAALQAQQPDLAQSILKWSQAGVAPQMAQLELARGALGLQQGQLGLQQGQQQLQLGQYELQKAPLELEQLKLALGKQNMLLNALTGQDNTEPNSSLGPASEPVRATGGIQNGPQATVATGPTLPSGSYNGSVGGSLNAGDFSGMNLSPHQTAIIGALAPEMLGGLQKAQEYQKTQAQLQAQGPLNLLDSVFDSAAPARTVMSNPSLMQYWPQYARQLGLDPVKDFNDVNVRKVLALAGNQLRGQVGMPAKDYPVQMQNVAGPYGQQLQVDPVTGKRTEVAGRQIPSYSLEPDVDLNTGKTNLTPVQTGGLTPRGQTPYSTSTGPVHSGYKEGVTQDEAKAAAFSKTFNNSDQTMRQIEDSGGGLNAKDRAALVNIVSSEDPSVIKQLASQEFLIHAMPEHTQSYITAAIPMIEALSHNQAGVRLPGNVIRAALESAIPINSMSSQQLKQTRDYRDSYLSSLDVGAGKAAFTGEFSGSIGQRRLNASPENPTGRPITRTIGGKTYTQIGGKWYAD